MKGAKFEDFPDDDYIFNRGWIANVPWTPRGNVRFARAAYEYLRLTGDAEVKRFAAKVADFQVANYWDKDRREFFYRPAKARDLSKGWVPLLKDATDLDDAHRRFWGARAMSISAMLGWCALTTGDVKHMDVARQAYERVVEMVRANEPQPREMMIGMDSEMEHFWGYLDAAERASRPAGTK